MTSVPASIPHHLIMVAAASPGAGKSTLSAYLARQLTLHGNSVRFFHEHDFLHHPAIARISRQWYEGDPRTLTTWLADTPAFFAPCTGSGETWITDALFPGFYALLGHYTPEQVAGFARRLAAIVMPLDPLIVFLDGDPATLLESRAVAQRGESWRHEFLEYAGKWHLASYSDAPIRTWEQYTRLLDWRRRHTLDLLAEWPSDVLIIDVEYASLSDAKRILLDYLKIDPLPDPPLPRALLEGAAGTYAREDDPAAQPLHITVQGDALHVDAYWESGALLLPEAESTFRLDATEQQITFVEEQDGEAIGLKYHVGPWVRFYRKVDPRSGKG